MGLYGVLHMTQGPPNQTSSDGSESDEVPSRQDAHEGSIKETFISLIISFVMALVFRSYVVEAFVIPTGSMAPTLRGAHIDFHSPQTGYDWAVNPWYADRRERPFPVQGRAFGQFIPRYGPPSATDPMTTTRLNPIPQRQPGRRHNGYITRAEAKRLRAGDRILVQKYLYEIFPPRRWDVVVFKNPEDSTQNFIKRLVGLPGEQLWLVDGDLFVRDVAAGESAPWRIARKPERVQRALWRTVFSSEYAPLEPTIDGRTWFNDPWEGGEGWQAGASRVYRYEGDGPTTLEWDDDDWPIWDWVPYNEWPGKLTRMSEIPRYPVGDVRLRAGIEPDTQGLVARASQRTRGHEFRATLEEGRVALEMRRSTPASGQGLEWTELASARWGGFAPGAVTNVEFWHFDQTLVLRVGAREVIRAEYDWSADDRLQFATGRDPEDYRAANRGIPGLGDPNTYAPVKPKIRWEFEGSALSMHRVGLDRDLYYEPARSGPRPGLATHPNQVATLSPEHYYVLGDNSPSSKDSRLWTGVDAPVRMQIDETVGVVHRKLMLGKAFFVYFPAPHMVANRVPIPDFGRMRFIR